MHERENRSKIHIVAGSRGEVERIFAGLAAVGEIELPIDAGSDGVCFGMFRDVYGIEWIVEFGGA